jgi:prophage regulatory protein
MHTCLERKPAVLGRLGIKHSKFHDDISKGLFTPPVALGPRCSAWPSHETEAIIRARIAGQSDDEIRALVKQLVAARASALRAA